MLAWDNPFIGKQQEYGIDFINIEHLYTQHKKGVITNSCGDHKKITPHKNQTTKKTQNKKKKTKKNKKTIKKNKKKRKTKKKKK